MTQKCRKIRKLLCLGCLVLLSSSTSLPTWTTRKVAPVGSLLALSLKFHFPLFFLLLSSSLCPLLMLSAHFEIFNFERLDLICHSCEIKEKKREKERKGKRPWHPTLLACSTSPSSFDFDCIQKYSLSLSFFFRRKK